MRIEITREIESFAADAESRLAERVERNVPATVLAQLRRGRFGAIEPLFACCHDESGQLRAVAMRTPPWPMLASGVDAGTASPLIERWLAEDPLLPGISAQPPSARAIAAAWAGITGGVTRCAMREAMHALSTPNDPTRPARGRLRLPVEQERDLLVQWEADFVRAGAGSQSSRGPHGLWRSAHMGRRRARLCARAFPRDSRDGPHRSRLHTTRASLSRLRELAR